MAQLKQKEHFVAEPLAAPFAVMPLHARVVFTYLGGAVMRVLGMVLGAPLQYELTLLYVGL